MSVDLTSIMYLSFRLAPFIIVSVFSLTSIIHQDFKGLIYLGGLLFTCVLAIIIGNLFKNYFPYIDDADSVDTNLKYFKCNIFTLTNQGPLSSIPLSITIFSYTYSYLLYVIVKYNLLQNNIPTLVIFPLLIISEIIWVLKNGCAPFHSLMIGIIIGILCGYTWSYMIDKSGMTNLKYYNGISTQVTCSSPSEPMFRCETVPTTPTT
jgi:hypothetical protein